MNRNQGQRRGRPSRGRGYGTYNQTTGTGALKEYPEPIKYRKRVVKRRAIKPKPKAKVKTRTRIIRGLSPKKIGMLTYLGIFMIFILGLGTAIAGANVTIQRNINVTLANTLRDIEHQNSQIYADILNARNLDDVEYIARNRLGMSEPLSHQIIPITLIPSREMVHDFTEPMEYELTFMEEVGGFFTRIVDFFIGDR